MELEKAFSLIREIPDFPSQGILFQDIAPMLADGGAFAIVAQTFAHSIPSNTLVAGIEARGFIFASAIALQTGNGFLPIRKAGKLPGEVHSQKYGLEYGTDTLEIQKGAFASGQEIVLIDDVLATGGTVVAAIKLLQASGAKVSKVMVLLEISILDGREVISTAFPTIEIISLVQR